MKFPAIVFLFSVVMFKWREKKVKIFIYSHSHVHLYASVIHTCAAADNFFTINKSKMKNKGILLFPYDTFFSSQYGYNFTNVSVFFVCVYSHTDK